MRCPMRLTVKPWLRRAAMERCACGIPATGKLLRKLNSFETDSGRGDRSFAFSSDGGMLASIGSNNAVQLWSTADYRELKQIVHLSDQVQHVAPSTDGKLLAGDCGKNVIRLWKVATGEEIAPAPGHDDAVSSLALTRDGKSLVTGSDDGTIRVWERRDRQASSRPSRTFAQSQFSGVVPGLQVDRLRRG